MVTPEDLSRAEEIFRDRWVSYPQAVDILGKAKVALLTAGRISPHCLLIYGPAKAGATALAGWIYRSLSGSEGSNQTKILRVQTPTLADPESMCAAVLDAARAYVPAVNLPRLRRAVTETLEDLGVELLQVEEVGNLSVTSEAPGRAALATLRGFANEKRALICIGASTSLAAVGADSQLLQRFRVIQLRPLAPGEEFANFVGKLTAALALPEPTEWSQAMVDKLYVMSQGLVGKIAPIVEELAFLAHTSKAPSITLEHLHSPELTELVRRHEQHKPGKK